MTLAGKSAVWTMMVTRQACPDVFTRPDPEAPVSCGLFVIDMHGRFPYTSLAFLIKNEREGGDHVENRRCFKGSFCGRVAGQP